MEYEGKEYTRVSEIIAPWCDFSGIPEGVLANKARIGTAVHECIAAETEGFPLGFEEDEAPYLECWREWVKEKSPTILETEKRLYCDDLSITGAVDGIMKEEGEVCVLDYKTSASASPKRWQMQCAFYVYLARKNGFEVCDYAKVIQLRKGGNPAKEYVLDCGKSVWEACLGALKAYRHFKG